LSGRGRHAVQVLLGQVGSFWSPIAGSCLFAWRLVPITLLLPMERSGKSNAQAEPSYPFRKSFFGSHNLHPWPGQRAVQFVLLVTNLFRKAPSTPSSEASTGLEWISSEAQ